MKKKIIVSGADKRVNPWLAFMLSLAVTGLGQVYRGKAARGTAFLLFRVIAVISVPCYSVLNPESNVAAEIAAAITAFLVITILSPAEALVCALQSGGSIKKKKYSSAGYYIVFSAVSLGITALSLVLFFSCFSFFRSSSAFNPLVEPGDILIANKIKRVYTRGESVFDMNYSLLRIIALPGETVSYKNRILSVNGVDLHRAIYTEDELNSLNLTDNNVTSEYNGQYRYAVIPSMEKFTITMETSGSEYCAASDERKDAGSFTKIPAGAIAASFEGVLISPSRKIVLVTPQMRSR
ncbi:MAG TPA: S26 family signal peptidase [Spirochaetota bacterium]|nr:S26 family signal peptidase [Spirochaetota bacterium]